LAGLSPGHFEKFVDRQPNDSVQDQRATIIDAVNFLMQAI